MTEKEPVTLAVHLDLSGGTWSVASVSGAFEVAPLIQSQPHDLDKWSEGSSDEQISFLRHRIAGILQQGADRLWGRQQKAQLFAIDFSYEDSPASGEIVDRVAQHFCTWLLKPPVMCLCVRENGTLRCIASNTDDADLEGLTAAVQQIRSQAGQTDLWEHALPRPPR